MHLGGLAERKHALDRHFQPARGDACQHVIDAGLPGGRSLVDMAEMQPGEGLRSRQDALADGS